MFGVFVLEYKIVVVVGIVVVVDVVSGLCGMCGVGGAIGAGDATGAGMGAYVIWMGGRRDGRRGIYNA